MAQADNTIHRQTSGIRTTAGGRTLPPEVLLSGVRRLRLLAWVLIAFMLFAFAVSTVLPLFGVRGPPWLTAEEMMVFFRSLRAMQIIGIVGAAAMIGITYWKTLPPELILNIGVGFQILGALLFSLIDFAVPWPAGRASVGLPKAMLWLMAFPLIPASLGRSAIAAFGSAAMGPVAMQIAAAMGRQVPDTTGAFFFYLPLFIGAMVVTLVSRVIHRLARDVSHARKLGSYRLVKKLAEGGMGEVWEARHGSLVRPAAIKLIRPDVLGHKSTEELDGVLRRFVREAQSTACMTSPHTVALYDFGRTADGTIYYVMELLGGLDLELMVRRYGPQPAARVVHLISQVCYSLAEAHRTGMVHRDIKPANLQLTILGGEFDFLKVLDFGLVKRLDETAGPLVTAENILTGTPAYLSPEGATGSRSVDYRSDLYSLGCVAYWLLTGKLVFPEETPMAMVLAHVRTPPIPPSQRTELPIPPELDALVLDLLAKDPAARPRSAIELARRLADVRFDEGWTQERAERWWRAHLPQEVTKALRENACNLPTPIEETEPEDASHEERELRTLSAR
jgi:serine/threonine-protein kinase